MALQFTINNILNTTHTYIDFKTYLNENYYNKIYTKKISDNIYIIYNKFIDQHKNDDQLYNECRSIIIKFNENSIPKILSYTHDNIKYYKTEQYIYESGDSFEESYEGTLISVFHHEGQWFLTTSRCGNIDNSFFYNKERTFGMFFDECLFNSLKMNRQEFLSNLDNNLNYYFVLVHHENKNIIDYTERFGPEYKMLFHVFTRIQETQELINYEIPNINYPLIFTDSESASSFLTNSSYCEGILVKRLNKLDNKIYMCKIHSDNYWLEKEQNPNYPNSWLCYLDIYKKNNPKFRITDYQLKKNIVEEITLNKKNVDITGLINLLFKGTAENLYNLLLYFTDFNHQTHTYIKKNDVCYKKLTDYKYQMLRKQISILQNLINKEIIKSADNLITHLKKHLTVEQFVNLLKAMYHLINETDLIIPSNKYYKKYLDLFLEKIEN